MCAPSGATLGFDAAHALADVARPLGTESVSLAMAGRRVLAAPLHAANSITRQGLAAMDGLAACETDLVAGTRRYSLAGAAYPGAPWYGAVNARETVRIMTGA